MSCQHVICAACSGPVAEGRCPTCRAARAELHGPHLHLTPAQITELVAILIAVVTALTLVASRGF
jgi:hypothetical protein